MILNRNLSSKLLEYTQKFKITALIGPRQSGKSTLLKSLFPEAQIYNLEDPSVRARVLADPSGFIADCPQGTILDEVQRVPELLSYIQAKVDSSKSTNAFILSGSANLLLMESISQSLAGRCGILELLPLDFNEMSHQEDREDSVSVEGDIFKGQYPNVLLDKIPAADFYRSYVMTFLERDVRQVLEVKNIHDFERFVRLCAGRTAQVLNISSLSNDCGISVTTCRHWLSVLETCYILKLVTPYNGNLSKRLTKSPKLFFIDAGLASYLIGVESEQQLITHPLRSALFETLVFSNLLKARYNQARNSNVSFFRDRANNEVDFVLESGDALTAIEVKSARTFSKDFFNGLDYFENLLKRPIRKILCYSGSDISLFKGETRAINYRKINDALS